MITKAHPDYGNTNGVKEWNTHLFVTDWTLRGVLGCKNRVLKSFGVESGEEIAASVKEV